MLPKNIMVLYPLYPPEEVLRAIALLYVHTLEFTTATTKLLAQGPRKRVLRLLMGPVDDMYESFLKKISSMLMQLDDLAISATRAETLALHSRVAQLVKAPEPLTQEEEDAGSEGELKLFQDLEISRNPPQLTNPVFIHDKLFGANLHIGRYRTFSIPEDSAYGTLSINNLSRMSRMPLGQKTSRLALTDIGQPVEAQEESSDMGSNVGSLQGRAEQFAADIAKELIEALNVELPEMHWSRLESLLPSRLQEFALQIGYQGETQKHRDIMWVAHNASKYV